MCPPSCSSQGSTERRYGVVGCQVVNDEFFHFSELMA